MLCIPTMMHAQAGHLILVRHGESEGNRDRTFTQTPNVPLTAHGREQAHTAAAQIAAGYAPSRIVASPFRRAQQTAEIIAAALGLAVETEPAFCEQSFGTFAGQPYEAVLADASYHATPRWHWQPVGGESLLDVYQRVSPAFDRLAKTGGGQDIVIVSHGGVMLALWAHVIGGWEDAVLAPNAGIVVVPHHNGTFQPPTLIGDR